MSAREVAFRAVREVSDCPYTSCQHPDALCVCSAASDAMLDRLLGADAATRLALIRDLMPETHAVVPKEPTSAMSDEGERILETEGYIKHERPADAAYHAMLAAAAQEGVSDAG